MYRNVKNKNIMAIIMAAALTLGTTGCGKNQIPDLTENQTRMIEEFVAVTMMKYDANHRSRLVELPENAFRPSLESTNTITPNTPEQQEPADSTAEPNVSEPEVKFDTIEEALALPEGVTVAFLGQKFCSYYPDDGEINGFVLPASEGKKLLILQFAMLNTSGQECTVDLMSLGAIYGFTINGDYTRRALRTMLPEDLSSFRGDIPVGGSAEAVLVVEVDETMDENITSLIFNVKNASKAFTVQLL